LLAASFPQVDLKRKNNEQKKGKQKSNKVITENLSLCISATGCLVGNFKIISCFLTDNKLKKDLIFMARIRFAFK